MSTVAIVPVVLIACAVTLCLVLLWRKNLIRPALRVGLVLAAVAVVAGWFLSHHRVPRGILIQHSSEQAEDAKITLPWSETVKSTWMKTTEEAVDDALEKARGSVAGLLRSKDPEMEWAPSPDYVRDHLLADVPDADDRPEHVSQVQVGTATAAEEVRDFGKEIGDMRRVELKLKVTGKEFHDMQRLGRQQRAEVRQQALAKLVVGFMAVMITVVVLSGLRGRRRKGVPFCCKKAS